MDSVCGQVAGYGGGSCHFLGELTNMQGHRRGVRRGSWRGGVGGESMRQSSWRVGE